MSCSVERLPSSPEDMSTQNSSNQETSHMICLKAIFLKRWIITCITVFSDSLLQTFSIGPWLIDMIVIYSYHMVQLDPTRVLKRRSGFNTTEICSWGQSHGDPYFSKTKPKTLERLLGSHLTAIPGKTFIFCCVHWMIWKKPISLDQGDSYM